MRAPPRIIVGSQVMICGNITSAAMVSTSATKNSATPRNTSDSGMLGCTPLTTKQFSPIGGVIRQTSTILTAMMPNQIEASVWVMPKGEVSAVAYSPPFSAITAG